jgi:hypothetical protein
MHSRKRSAISMGFVLACFLLTFGAPSAQGGAVYIIATPNVGLSPYSGPYATVNVDLIDSTHAGITFTSQTATSGNTNCTPATPCTYLMGGNDAMGVNINAAGFTVNPTTGSGSGNLDGFGVFNLTIGLPDGFGQVVSTYSFNVENTSGTWADASSVLTANTAGYLAGAHIYVQSSACTDEKGNPAACITGYAVNGDPVVPEPGTLALLGAGLIFIGGAIRKFKG